MYFMVVCGVAGNNVVSITESSPMCDHILENLRVFVAEDEMLLAIDLCETLERAGASIIGPARSLAAARSLVQSGEVIDVALIDLNLAGESAQSVVLDLAARGVPVIIATGYNPAEIPAELRGIRVCPKPLCESVIVRTLREAVVANDA